MRKACWLALIGTLLITLFVNPVWAKPAPAKQAVKTATIFIDGKQLNTGKQPALVKNGIPLVPVKLVGEALGAEVEIDNKYWTSIGKFEQRSHPLFGDKWITVLLGASKAQINEKDVPLAVPYQKINGYMVLPAAFLAQSLDCHFKWNPKTNRIDIYAPHVKEQWYQQSRLDVTLIQRYPDFNTYEEPNPLSMDGPEQVFLQTVSYGDTSVKTFHAFMVTAYDLTEYSKDGSKWQSRQEMEVTGKVDDKHWTFSFNLYAMDYDTRELSDVWKGSFQTDMRMTTEGDKQLPDYDFFPFSCGTAMFVGKTVPIDSVLKTEN